MTRLIKPRPNERMLRSWVAKLIRANRELLRLTHRQQTDIAILKTSIRVLVKNQEAEYETSP